MKFPNLSYRIKIPLAISAVILLTEVVVTATLVTRAYADARADLEANARNLTTVLARSLRDPLLRDDLWQAYEVIRTPLAARTADNPLQDIVVLDAQLLVYVASDPVRLPVLTPLTKLDEPLIRLVADGRPDTFDMLVSRGSARSGIAAAGPILADDGTRLGTVLLSFDAQRYYTRVRSTLLQLALVSLPGLLLLIPLGWYWGKQMAEPLGNMARALSRVGRDAPASIAADLPPESRDEIGVLARRTRGMLEQLERKESMEQEMIASERLAAVGRVSAAIAHEINNPLGGMINAIDTARSHGRPDPITGKTLDLLERGLDQIRTTVSALLVEARLDSPELSAQDWQDLRTLIEPQLADRRIQLVWSVDFPEEARVRLPAHLIRQLVLNILLNAVKSAGSSGKVELVAQRQPGRLHITVTNTGAPIPPDMLGRLFEPFVVATERDGKRSYGLGLWVCYQIVQQLKGTISAASADGLTRFEVTLPFSEGSIAAPRAA
ncbi:MAG TPA: HAMP domain-containing sensor histidine kinase [Burkholderiaceae bacterium]|nr:HAMP domain-containing sensor histidine kinase [Burkholderiaceae bacterium]HQR72143.1 HAMP domain-containing sensor histidine kinase [Burkholderiaceae bacterium]